MQKAGLTPQQFSLLVLLGASRDEGVNIGAAAEELHIAHNSVVGLSQRAEQAGLLTRVSAGGRRQGTTLHLTELGARRLDEVTRTLITELAGDRLLLVETLSRWNTVLAARGLAPGGAARGGDARYGVRRALAPDKPLVWHLLQLYLHELSPLLNAVPDERGQYGYPAFDAYWGGEGHIPYLFHAEERPAGFALVRRRADKPGPWHVLEEFCVLRPYQGQGLGAALIGEVLRRHPGRWSVASLQRNPFTHHFWEYVLPRHAAAPPVSEPDETRPEVTHFTFEVSIPAARA
ncbi:GNAT family N-acetyltransferase [Deinococcus aerius]|uniref:GNAT family N-acetyltransferase n=1 Tax=Deinococcus aerius TaxID=200253 RepID=UPI0022866A2E|nr:GNAT family N-acetyltransferase [Deinococcus aerius]